jgi:hypothetical protein
MKDRPATHLAERMVARRSQAKVGSVDSERELMLEDARTIQQAEDQPHHLKRCFPRADWFRGRTPFRKPLQFIVMSVTVVISSTFPHTYGVFYMTVNSRRV